MKIDKDLTGMYTYSARQSELFCVNRCEALCFVMAVYTYSVRQLELFYIDRCEACAGDMEIVHVQS
jgi:hypothetical protein